MKAKKVLHARPTVQAAAIFFIADLRSSLFLLPAVQFNKDSLSVQEFFACTDLSLQESAREPQAMEKGSGLVCLLLFSSARPWQLQPIRA